MDTHRVQTVLRHLQRSPDARTDVDVNALAPLLDTLFWSVLAETRKLRRAERTRWINAATHLVYHALFANRSA